MNKVKAFIERGIDGSYGVYVDLEDDTLNYGIHGEGDTVNEAIEDFIAGYIEMKELYKKEEKKFIETAFIFHYDTTSFLNYYTTYFSLDGLSRLSGINQRQLSHYANGTRNPSKQTIQKIDNAIHAFGSNLNKVQFV